jgi:aerobic carbon-monoxide dehydrogenase small subunit
MTRTVKVEFTLNGSTRIYETDVRSLLVEMIRTADARGSRIGCLTGDCGACTVLLDGKPTKSCLMLAVAVSGSAVITIEGSTGRVAESLKASFVANKGFQCGYCTSGMIVTAAAFLEQNPDPTEDEIRAAIGGNLCRCTGYDDIVSSIAAAAKALKEQDAK